MSLFAIKTISSDHFRPVPHLVTLVLCSLFAILYGVWILPHTVFIRHTAMVIGSLLGLWVIYANFYLLLQKKATPIAFILGLFIWVTFHLFWIGKDFPIQYLEYTKIWKKIILCFPFAVGLGLSILLQSNNATRMRSYWRIIFFGLLLPALIYFIKFGVTQVSNWYGFSAPRHLMLDGDHMGSHFGVSRAWYVFYCLPALAISMGIIMEKIKARSFSIRSQLIYVICVPVTLLIFLIENDRLGALLGSAIVSISCLYGLTFLKEKWTHKNIVIVLATFFWRLVLCGYR